jgi:hypothetical protein
LEKLEERGRMNKAIFKSLGWALSLKPLVIHQELAQAHKQILFLRCQIRKCFVVTEEQETVVYRSYAEALSRLEDVTGR